MNTCKTLGVSCDKFKLLGLMLKWLGIVGGVFMGQRQGLVDIIYGTSIK